MPNDAAFREALDALVKLCADYYEPPEGMLDAALARVLALYAEALAGEVYEVLMVVNPEYPGDRHYWDARNVPTFPAHYIITPGVFRVTKVEEGQ